MGVYSLPVGTEGYKSITMSETELQDYLDHGLNAEEIAEAESGEPLEGITIEDVTIGPAVAK
jgi:phage FluMu protein gp41